MFGDTYILKAQFENVQGLVKGNNVRFSGIQVGTVQKITLLSDTAIEVSMKIDKKMMPVIRKNAFVSIATDGIVGNKLVNIIPAKQPAAYAVAGDVLHARKTIPTDEILQTLSNAGIDVGLIMNDMKKAVRRLNNSRGLWALLDDESIPRDLKASLQNIRQATGKTRRLANDLEYIVSGIKDGKGPAGMLLTDSSFAAALSSAVLQVNTASRQADSLIRNTNNLITDVRMDVQAGRGTLHALLKDSVITSRIASSLENIEKGTDAFNQNMEAFKHNFLVRGYFRKQAKKKQITNRK
jgi:phospholipid/cholesterol/gamma-HCH transport system substrate-binding protein